MHNKRFLLIGFLSLVLILTQLACDLGSMAPQVEIPNVVGPATDPTSIVVQQEPTPDIEVPDPQPGTGNVVGRILWNNQPVVGTEVILCEEFGMFSGCQGINFSVNTDQNGYYLFTDIPPGEYALAAHAIDRDRWIYVVEGLGFTATKYLVQADDTLIISSKSIYKYDLVQNYPADGASVTDGQPTLTWEAYPGAAYYEVYLTPDRGHAIFVSEKINDTQISPVEPLLNCEYTWQIEAFNTNGVKIAEYDGYYHFTITGQQFSCEILLTFPQDGASVSGNNLQLSWEEHPLASYYRVHIWDQDYVDILDSVHSNEVNYIVSQVINPGIYTWYITAYNSSDDDIARSDFYEFTVP